MTNPLYELQTIYLCNGPENYNYIFELWLYLTDVGSRRCWSPGNDCLVEVQRKRARNEENWFQHGLLSKAGLRHVY